MTRPGHHEWNKNFWSFFVRCLVESVTHGWSIVTTRIKASGGHCARQGCSIHLVSTARLSDLGSRRMLKENSLRDYYTKGKGMRLFVSLRCEIKIFGLYVMQPVWFSCCRGRTPPPPPHFLPVRSQRWHRWFHRSSAKNFNSPVVGSLKWEVAVIKCER